MIVYILLFSSGGCCSLQPKDQPVTKQVSSTVQSVQSELMWAQLHQASYNVLLCVELDWWTDLNIMPMHLLQLWGGSQLWHQCPIILQLLQITLTVNQVTKKMDEEGGQTAWDVLQCRWKLPGYIFVNEYILEATVVHVLPCQLQMFF